MVRIMRQRLPTRKRRLPTEVALLAIGAAAFSCCEAQDAVLRAFPVTEHGAFSAMENPDATIWSRVPEEIVPLNLAPPVHQSIALLQSRNARVSGALPVGVSVITDGQRIYFRLRWRDTTQDARRSIGSFADAAAVQIPVTVTETSPVMGSPDRPVSIWRWSADRNNPEALLAGSPGTLTSAASTTLRGKGVYRRSDDPAKNEWRVVLSGDLDEARDDGEALRSQKSIPAAFAVWQGSDGQRGGFKRVSYWIPVEMPVAQR